MEEKAEQGGMEKSFPPGGTSLSQPALEAARYSCLIFLFGINVSEVLI